MFLQNSKNMLLLIISLLLLTNQSIMCFSQDKFLTSHYPLDQVINSKVQDQNKQDSKGTFYQNQVLGTSPQIIEKSLVFLTDPQTVVELPNDPTLDIGLEGEVSIMLYLKGELILNQYNQPMESTIFYSGQQSITIYQSQGQLFIVTCNETIYFFNNFGFYFDNAWHHFAVTIKNGMISTYMDGKLFQKYKYTCDVNTFGSDLYLGREGVDKTLPFYQENFQGQIKHLKIFRKSLSQSQVYVESQLYTGNCPLMCQDGCQIENGIFIKCLTCYGDRVLKGNLCLCPAFKEDTYTYEECFNYIPEYKPDFLTFKNQNMLINQAVEYPDFKFVGGQDYSSIQPFQIFSKDYIQIIQNNNGIFDFGSNDFLFSIQFKVDAITDFQTYLLDIMQPSSYNFFAIQTFSTFDSQYQTQVYYINIFYDNQFLWQFFIYPDVLYSLSFKKYRQHVNIILMQSYYTNYQPVYLSFLCDIDTDFTFDTLILGGQTNSPTFKGQIGPIYVKKGVQQEYNAFIKLFLLNSYFYVQDQKPKECQEFSKYYGTYVCITCSYNRIHNGKECVCPEGFYSAKYMEQCYEEIFPTVYINFNQNFIDNNSNTQIAPVNFQQGFYYGEDAYQNLNSALYFSYGSHIQNQEFSTYIVEYGDFAFAFWIKYLTQGPVIPNQIIITNLEYTFKRFGNSNDVIFILAENIQNSVIFKNALNEEWNHIIVQRVNETKLQAYLNMELIQEKQISRVNINNANDLHIGATYIYNELNVNNNYFMGFLDDFRFYRTSLKMPQIQNIYQFNSLQCPTMCPGTIGTHCNVQSGEFICIQCLGNRVLINNLCICPPEFNQDYQTTETCIDMTPPPVEEKQPLSVYISFDKTTKSQGNNQVEATYKTLKLAVDKFGVADRAIDLENSEELALTNNNGIYEEILNKDFSINFDLKGKPQGKFSSTVFTTSENSGISLFRKQSSNILTLSIANIDYDIANVLDDAWHNISIQLQNNFQQLVVLIDKVQVISQQIFDNNNVSRRRSLNQNQIAVDSYIAIGNSYTNNKNFEGYMDEFRIYEKVIDQEELSKIVDYQCAFNCIECDVLQGGTTCKQQEGQDQIVYQCRGDRIYNQNTEQCECPQYYFDDQNNEFCQKCPDNCIICESESVCLVCTDSLLAPSLQLRNVDQLCTCPTSQYFDTKGPECQKCTNQYCKKCSDANTCETCYTHPEENFRSQTNDCTCPVGLSDNPQYYKCIQKCRDNEECSKCSEITPSCFNCQEQIPFCLQCDVENGGCLQCSGDLHYFDGKCQCKQGKITSDLSDLKNDQCKDCPEGALCLGGSKIQIQQGFWRNSDNTDKIIKCENSPENCKGGEGDAVSQCKLGHVGPLCENCDIQNKRGDGRYYQSGQYQCFSCEEKSIAGLQIFGLIVYQFLILYLCIGGNEQSLLDNQQEEISMSLFKSQLHWKREKGIITKMMLNYIYLISGLIAFRLSLQKDLEAIANPLKAIMMFLECDLAEMSENSPITYNKILFAILIYVLEGIVALFVILVLKKLSYVKGSMVSYTISVLSCEFIILGPGIMQMIWEAIACRKIGGETYILGQIQDICHTDQQYNYAYGLGLVLIILIIFIIPLTLFLCMKNNKKSLNFIKNKVENKNTQKSNTSSNNIEIEYKNQLQSAEAIEKYGILYLEYKNGQFYWELLQLYVKFLAALILAFYYDEIQLKGILLSLLIGIYCITQHLVKPYQKQTQQSLDMTYHLVCAFSFILAVYVQDNAYDYWKYIAYVFLILINVLIMCIFVLRIVRSQFHEQLSQIRDNYFYHQKSVQKDKLLKEHKMLINNKKIIENEIYIEMDLENSDASNKQEAQNNEKIKEISEKIENKENELKEYELVPYVKQNTCSLKLSSLVIKIMKSKFNGLEFQNTLKLRQALRDQVEFVILAIQQRALLTENLESLEFLNKNDYDVKFYSLNQYFVGEIPDEELEQLKEEMKFAKNENLKIQQDLTQLLMLGLEKKILGNKQLKKLIGQQGIQYKKQDFQSGKVNQKNFNNTNNFENNNINTCTNLNNNNNELHSEQNLQTQNNNNQGYVEQSQVSPLKQIQESVNKSNQNFQDQQDKKQKQKQFIDKMYESSSLSESHMSKSQVSQMTYDDNNHDVPQEDSGKQDQKMQTFRKQYKLNSQNNDMVKLASTLRQQYYEEDQNQIQQNYDNEEEQKQQQNNEIPMQNKFDIVQKQQEALTTDGGIIKLNVKQIGLENENIQYQQQSQSQNIVQKAINTIQSKVENRKLLLKNLGNKIENLTFSYKIQDQNQNKPIHIPGFNDIGISKSIVKMENQQNDSQSIYSKNNLQNIQDLEKLAKDLLSSINNLVIKDIYQAYANILGKDNKHLMKVSYISKIFQYSDLPLSSEEIQQLFGLVESDVVQLSFIQFLSLYILQQYKKEQSVNQIIFSQFSKAKQELGQQQISEFIYKFLRLEISDEQIKSFIYYHSNSAQTKYTTMNIDGFNSLLNF